MISTESDSEKIAMINRLPELSYERKNSADEASGLDLSAIQSWREEVEKLIGQYPAAFLAASLGIGFLIGWWKKRK